MGFYDTLEQNIAKYGGDDQAYKLKLQTHFRDLLGYSNYKSKMTGAMDKGLDLSRMKGNITPQGVKQLVSGAVNMQQNEVEGYGKMVNTVDQASGMLAQEQIAREKEAAALAKKASEDVMNRVGLENGVTFIPQTALDKKILEYMQNPTNGDGSIKSLQQFESELNKYYDENQTTSDKDPNPTRVWTEEEINEKIKERIPQDYIGNEGKYFLMSQGFSEKQALAHDGALRYASGQMSEPEKIIFEQVNGTLATQLKSNQGFEGAIKDISEQESHKNPDTGEVTTSPKYTFEQLKNKYPLIPDAELKNLASPVYKNDAMGFIEEQLNTVTGKMTDELAGMKKWYERAPHKVLLGGDKYKERDMTVMDQFYNVYQGQDENYPEGGMEAVIKTNTYKEMRNKMGGYYGDIFSGPELDRLLFESLINRM